MPDSLHHANLFNFLQNILSTEIIFLVCLFTCFIFLLSMSTNNGRCKRMFLSCHFHCCISSTYNRTVSELYWTFIINWYWGNKWGIEWILNLQAIEGKKGIWLVTDFLLSNKEMFLRWRIRVFLSIVMKTFLWWGFTKGQKHNMWQCS